MNLLFLSFSSGWGGLEMYLHRTARPLADRGHQVGAVCRPGTPIEDACRDADLEVFPLSPGPTRLLGVPSLAGLIRDREVDVVHVLSSRDLGRAVLAIRLAGRGRLVFTEQMGGRRPKKDPYHAWVYRGVDRVLAISEVVRERNLANLPIRPEQSRLLYYGIDLHRFTPGSLTGTREERRRQFALPEDRTLIGMVGRISAMKGHELLLESFSRLTERHPRVDLVFAGDGSGSHGGEPELFARLEDRAAMPDLAGRVHFTGFTPLVPELNDALDVVAVCSDSEAFGLTVVESMAMARAVVGSRSGAVPEILRHQETGLLYTPGDAADLSRQLERLIQDEELRRRLGDAARRDVEARFSLERHLEALEAIYGELVRPPPGSA